MCLITMVLSLIEYRNTYNVVVYIVRNMSLFAIIYGKYFVVVNKNDVLHLLNLR